MPTQLNLSRKNYYPFFGAVNLDDCWTMVGIFYNFHDVSVSWLCNENCRGASTDKAAYQMLTYLQNAPKTSWSSLCSAAGWTSYGAVALSWCKDAAIADVWSGWLSSGFPLKPLPEFERPARFINPALLPQSDSLSGIAVWVKAQGYKDAATYDMALCAVIAALKTSLVFDIEAEKLRKLSPQISAFLKSRMLQKSGRSAEEDALIEVWSTSVKGTEYDVWEVN